MVTWSSSTESAASPGLSLRKLCRIAGASLMLAGALYVWAFVAEFILPVQGPQTTENLLQYIATYRLFFVISYALFTAANSLSIVGAFGIYVVTRVADRSYALLGAATLVVGFIVTLLSSTQPALLTLSAAYSAATNVVDKQALAIAAEAVTSTNNPLIAASFIGVGVILVSLAMLKGVFGKGWLNWASSWGRSTSSGCFRRLLATPCSPPSSSASPPSGYSGSAARSTKKRRSAGSCCLTFAPRTTPFEGLSRLID